MVACEGMRKVVVETAIRRLLDSNDLAGAARVAIEEYGPGILGYLVALLRNEDDGREAFGQFCEDLWRGLPGFRGKAAFRTWAYALAYHAANRFARQPYRRRMRRIVTSEISKVADRMPTSTVPRLRSIAARLRERLDPDDQTLLILRVDREMSWDDVAHVLSMGGRSVDSAVLRKRFERLKQRLARMAEDAGLRRR
jgi:RNA polymerase sigma-70 factor, ECF subfamily